MILENTFYIFFDSKLLFFQKVENQINIEDIKRFAKNNFFFNEVHFSYEINYYDKNIKSYDFYYIKKLNLFKIYIFYLLLLISVCSLYLLSNKTQTLEDESISNLNEKYKKIKMENKYFWISDFLANFYKNSIKFNVNLKQLSIKNDNLILSISSKEEKDIFTFLKFYKVEVENISYDKKTREYNVNANFKIN